MEFLKAPMFFRPSYIRNGSSLFSPPPLFPERPETARTGHPGVVFRIQINSGKSICALSVVGSENEVMLPPNACLVVTNPIHTEADGIQYVDLLEVAGKFRW